MICEGRSLANRGLWHESGARFLQGISRWSRHLRGPGAGQAGLLVGAPMSAELGGLPGAPIRALRCRRCRRERPFSDDICLKRQVALSVKPSGSDAGAVPEWGGCGAGVARQSGRAQRCAGQRGFREHCLSSAVAQRLQNELRSGRCPAHRCDLRATPAPHPAHRSMLRPEPSPPRP